MEKIKKKIKEAVDAYKSRNLSKASQITKKLIETNPKLVFLYNLLGLIFQEQEKIEEALKCYEKGIEIDPNFATIYNNLGLLYFRNKYQNNHQKIEKYYKKAISLNKNMVEAYSNLGNFYSSVNKYEEAKYNFKKAIEINPKFSFAFLNLASVNVSFGKFDEAKKALLEAIAISPNLIHAHRLMSRLIKYTKNHKHLNQLLKLHNETELNNDERKMNLAFALGKAFEDTKEFDKSFSFYNEANELFRKNIKFSIKTEKEKFNEIKDVYNEKIFAKYDGAGYQESKPIFIVGMPRSGTTLIEQILSSHPEVFGADEIEFIPNIIRKQFGNQNINLFYNEVVKFDKTNFKKFGAEYNEMINKLSNNANRTTDKLPSNFDSIGFIKLILPNAKIIHCTRNSNDTCLSIFKNHFTSGKINFAYDLNEIVAYYSLYNDLMKHWESVLPDFMFNVSYENLIKNPDQVIKTMLKNCDLEWSNNCLAFYKNNRAIKTASDVQVRNKLYKSSINSWKNYEKYVSSFFSKLKI
jgi:Tfp pilus assembly protein PilF